MLHEDRWQLYGRGILYLSSNFDIHRWRIWGSRCGGEVLGYNTERFTIDHRGWRGFNPPFLSKCLYHVRVITVFTVSGCWLILSLYIHTSFVRFVRRLNQILKRQTSRFHFVFSACCMRIADSCMAGVFCICHLTSISTDGGYGAGCWLILSLYIHTSFVRFVRSSVILLLPLFMFMFCRSLFVNFTVFFWPMRSLSIQ
jgi:hypothetical protein